MTFINIFLVVEKFLGDIDEHFRRSLAKYSQQPSPPLLVVPPANQQISPPLIVSPANQQLTKSPDNCKTNGSNLVSCLGKRSNTGLQGFRTPSTG